jgi:hypothetical protein
MNKNFRKCEYEGCTNKPLKLGKCCYKHSPKCEYPKCKKVVRQDGFCCKEHQKICKVCKRWYRGEKCDSYECRLCKTEGCNNKPYAWTYCQMCRCEKGIDCNCNRKKDKNRKTCKKCHETMYISWELDQLFSNVQSRTQIDSLHFKYPIKKIMENAELPYFDLIKSTCKVEKCNVQLPIKMHCYDYIPTCKAHRDINFCLRPLCFNRADRSSKFYPYCGEKCEPTCSLKQCEYYNPDYMYMKCRHCKCRSNCSNKRLEDSIYCQDCHQSYILYLVFHKKYGLPRDIYKKILREAGVKRFAKNYKDISIRNFY